MASDVSHPEKNLPPRWKARLSDQPPIERSPKTADRQRSVEDDTTPARVVIEPTEPVTEQGLPAFKIKQEIDPQPTGALPHSAPDLRNIRIGAVLIMGAVAAFILTAIWFVLFG